MAGFDLEAWKQAHGGLAGPPDAPDTYGDVTYRAADGAYVVLHRDGTPAQQGMIPGAATTTPATSAASDDAEQAPPIATGAGLSQDQVLAQLAQMAPGNDPSRLKYVEKFENRRVTVGTAGSLTDPQRTVTRAVPVRIWYDPATKQAIKFDVKDDGTFVQSGYGVDSTLPNEAPTTKPPIPSGGSSSTEGTPIKDANGNITGWDNTRPRQVIKDKNGNVVWSEELTGADLTAWRAAQQANQPQTAEARTPVQGRPGWTQITRKKVEAGKTVEVTTFVGPDNQEVATLPAETASDVKDVPGHPGWTVKVTKVGNDTKTTYYDPAGVEKPPPPDAPTYTVRDIPVNGEHHTQIVMTPKDGSAPTITNYGPNGQKEEAFPTEGRRALPAGMPPLDTSSADAARQSYLAQVRWTQQQVQAGNLSSKEAVDLLTPSHESAQSVIDAEQRQIENQRAARTQDITQEGNRLQAATSQLANTKLDVGEIAHYAPVGGTQAGTAYLTNLLLQGLMNRGVAGTAGAISPTQAALPMPGAPSELGQPGDPAPSSVVTPETVAGTGSGSAMLDNVAAVAARVGPEQAAAIRANPVFRPMAPVGSPVLVGSGITAPSLTADPSAAPTATTPAVTPPTLNRGQDLSSPPVGLADPSALPPFLQNLQGRAFINSLMQQGYGA